MQGHLRKNDCKMKILELYNSLEQKIWSFKSCLQPLIENLFRVLKNRIKKSQVKLKENIFNFIVKWWKNCKFCRALAQFWGKMSCISWRHNSLSQVFTAEVGMLAITWHQNNGKMADKDQSHVIGVRQNLKRKGYSYYDGSWNKQHTFAI